MRGKKFDILLSGASLLGALIGAAIMFGSRGTAMATPGQRAVWVGAVFVIMFLLGFGAMQLAITFSKRYKIQRQPYWYIALVLACILIFGIGVGGQYLFMYSKEEVVTPAEVDMVLLLDASGSMTSAGYDAPRTDAACQFVDSLDEDCRLQAKSFAGTVLDSSQLLVMNDANKAALKQLIMGIDASGMTDFNEPLQEAMDTLNSQGRQDCNKAVILLTDGQSWLDSSVVNSYLNSDIRVFTIRINTSTIMTVEDQDLVDLAQGTGGFDTLLQPGPDGSIDTAAMVQAFQDAFEATSKVEVNMSEDLIVYSENQVTFWQFMIRLLVLVLCAAIIGIGYFGRFSAPTLVANGVMGAAAAVMIGFFDGESEFLCAVILCLLVTSAYVILDLGKEDSYDV